MEVNSFMNFLGQRKRNTEIQCYKDEFFPALSSSSKNAFIYCSFILELSYTQCMLS